MANLKHKKFVIHLGQRIKEIRKEKNITQLMIADTCGFDVASVSRIEGGKSNMTITTLKSIAVALEVDIGDLLQ